LIKYLFHSWIWVVLEKLSPRPIPVFDPLSRMQAVGFQSMFVSVYLNHKIIQIGNPCPGKLPWQQVVFSMSCLPAYFAAPAALPACLTASLAPSSPRGGFSQGVYFGLGCHGSEVRKTYC